VPVVNGVRRHALAIQELATGARRGAQGAWGSPEDFRICLQGVSQYQNSDESLSRDATSPEGAT
jgi:hypothetical protein